jgi:hypothetical protein
MAKRVFPTVKAFFLIVKTVLQGGKVIFPAGSDFLLGFRAFLIKKHQKRVLSGFQKNFLSRKER